MRTLIISLAPSVGVAGLLVSLVRAGLSNVPAPVPVPIRIERRGRR